ncbi:MAG: 23S rRNA (uracil(1939)-C(5))-methyltransferase RlmD [Lachnospiraceae bacterium]|nr:23S rRNA (uracil(1939)-C(5))-methyltransferase RlmD [Lachnospiraceae bacterium]
MNKNELFTVDITDVGSDGEGIGKTEGFTWFIKDTIPGDVIEASVMKIKKNYGFARMVRIITPSPDRVESACPIARSCGGCTLQAMSYEAQLRFKQSKVFNNLTRLGGLNCVMVSGGADAEDGKIPVLETIGMDSPWRYRNKAQLPIGYDKNGRLVAGFYAGHSHNIIPQDDCLIGAEENEAITKCVLDFCTQKHISAYDETRHEGLLRHILLRKGYYTGEIMVCLVINGESLPCADELVSRLREFDGMSSISLNVNRERTNVILGSRLINLYGPGYITDMIGELTFKINPLSFFQVNPVQTAKLYAKALEYAALTGGENVWDLYCGIGTISLFLAQKAGFVRGVEIIPEAIDNARDNAAMNGLENTQFYVGSAEDVVPEVFEKEHCHADVIVVDPPRKGCDEKLLETIVKMTPDRVVYVSCDSATLARDLKWMGAHGYQTVKAQPVDMFPHSGHVETVCLLSNTQRPKKESYITLDVEMEDYYRIKNEGKKSTT